MFAMNAQFSLLEEVKNQSHEFPPNSVFTTALGALYESDSISFMRQMPDKQIDMIFADPPYNINKASWDRFDSQDHYIAWSISWIKEAARLLKDSGTMFICGFSEILADLKRPAMQFFHSCRWLIWHYKNKANLGNDWGRSHESILVLRKSDKFTMNIENVRIPYGSHTLKYPSHPQAVTSNFGKGKKNRNVWQPHPNGAKPKDVLELPTICNGMEEKTAHPTQKPEELLRKLILASSSREDIIFDPFCGSGTTAVVAEQLGRKWIGCEIDSEYNSHARQRLQNLVSRSEEEWIEFDRKNALRRASIR